MTGLSHSERVGYALSAFESIGIGREGALGALGGLAGESGFGLNTSAFNKNDPNGGSYGIGQWHSERLDGLKSFAEKSKYGIDDFRTQVDYIVHELKTTHRNVAAKLRDPNITRDKAVKTWTRSYEIPKKEYEFLDKRAAYANRYAAIAAGIPVDTATPKELKSIEDAVAAITGNPISLAAMEPSIADVSLTGAELGGTKSKSKYADVPEVGPTPTARPGTEVAAAQPAQTAQLGDAFDMSRFGMKTAPTPPDAVDMGRFGTPGTPSLSVAYRDQTPLDRTARLNAAPDADAAAISMAALAANPSPLAAMDMARFNMSPVSVPGSVQSPNMVEMPAAMMAALGTPYAAPAALDALTAIDAQFSLPAMTTPAVSAYVDPQVNAVNAPAPAAAAPVVGSVVGPTPTFANTPAAATPASQPGAFEGAFTGITGAIEGLFSDLTDAGTAINKGDITGAFQALSGTPKTDVPAATTTSQTVAADAAEKAQTNTALGRIEGFLDADTTFGGVAGAVLGGYFGGPLGAIAGGLLGQGLNQALSKAPTDKEAAAKTTEAQGIAGGVGRAMDNLFGGLFGQPKSPAQAGGMSRDYFPDAPTAPSDRSVPAGTFSDSDRAGAEAWGRDNPDATPGLW